jgi:hypothetical protein
MREREINATNDPNNDPQQKLVCKFVNDAKQFVERSHSWNALRKMWIIDPAHEVYKYTLNGASEQSRIYLVRYMSGAVLKEANPRWIERQQRYNGIPNWYSIASVNDHKVVLTLHPQPDNTFADSHDIYEYDEAFLDDDFDDGSITVSPDRTLMVYGFAHQDRLKEDADTFLIPEDPVLYYALAYSARERGESGGASSVELFAIAKQYLSDAISWDVANSHLEYTWATG